MLVLVRFGIWASDQPLSLLDVCFYSALAVAGGSFLVFTLRSERAFDVAIGMLAVGGLAAYTFKGLDFLIDPEATIGEATPGRGIGVIQSERHAYFRAALALVLPTFLTIGVIAAIAPDLASRLSGIKWLKFRAKKQ